MKSVLTYLKYIGYVLVGVLVSIFIISLFGYFDVFSSKAMAILKLIMSLVPIFIGAFILGKHSLNKGYLKGILLGTAISLTLFILSLIFGNSIVLLKIVFYYLIIIGTSMLGSMIGINYRKK